MIERLSMTDQLTNLPNRRSFDARLYMEWNRALYAAKENGRNRVCHNC